MKSMEMALHVHHASLHIVPKNGLSLPSLPPSRKATKPPTNRSVNTTHFYRQSMRTLLQIPRYILVFFIRLYQRFISPLLPPSCRYTPTCSEYAIQALQKYGAIKGTILAAYRIMRCNPWGGQGYDPPRWFGEPSNEKIQ